MSKNSAVGLSEKDAAYQAEADRFIAESLKILKKLEMGRRHSVSISNDEPNILVEVKAILRGKSDFTK
jgi:hypothetical protein